MISKKKIAAIILFLLLSLFMFTFANPSDNPNGDEVLPSIVLSESNTYVMEVHSEVPEFKATAESFTAESINVVITNNINRHVVGEYTVTFTATDAYGNKQVINRKFNVVDTTRPVITLIGDSSYKRILGYEVYNDEGARVTDNYDETDTINGTISGNVSALGRYTIIYNHEDANGNDARQVIRTIQMLDPYADEDNDGYSNLEEFNNDTDYDDPNDYPDYDKAPTITIDENNNYVMEVHGIIPEFKALANDTADGSVPVIITHNIDKDVVGTYTVTFTATDSLGNNKVITRSFNVVDPTKPVITLIGNSSYKRILGYETYTDEGANVTDNYDASITKLGQVVGDPLVVGNYTINYDYTDANGNIADTVTRTIKMLNPDADEDNDGYTNLEELNNNTDYDDPNDYPVDLVPTITVDPVTVTIDRLDNYNVYTGITISDDFDMVALAADITDTTTLAVGTYTITYTVGPDRKGQTATETRQLIVEENPNDLLFNHITAELNPTTYNRLDPMGTLTVTAYDNYGTATLLNSGDYIVVTPFDSSTVGSKTMTVSYTKDLITSTVNINYEVVKNSNDLKFKEITAELNPTTYYRDSSMGILTVTAWDNFGTATILASGDYIVVTPFDSSTVGSKTMTVSYTKDLITSTVNIDYVINTPLSEVQVGIFAEVKPNVQLVFTKETPTTKNISDYIDVYNVYADSSKHLTTNYTTDFSTQTVGDDITLLITQDSYTFSDIKYTVKNETVYQTKFNLSYNGSTHKPHCLIDCTTDYDFLEIREHFILPISVKDVSIKYEDALTYESIDNVEWRGLDDLFTSVRIGWYNDHNIMPPVIDKVSITYEWLFRDYTIIFRYNSNSNTFDAISES